MPQQRSGPGDEPGPFLLRNRVDTFYGGQHCKCGENGKNPLSENRQIRRLETSSAEPDASEQGDDEERSKPGRLPIDQAFTRLEHEADGIGDQEVEDNRGAAGDVSCWCCEEEEDNRRSANAEGAVGEAGGGTHGDCRGGAEDERR